MDSPSAVIRLNIPNSYSRLKRMEIGVKRRLELILILTVPITLIILEYDTFFFELFGSTKIIDTACCGLFLQLYFILALWKDKEYHSHSILFKPTIHQPPLKTLPEPEPEPEADANWWEGQQE